MSGRGRIAERWEKNRGTMTNALINLYCIDFFIVINKIAKNRQELLHLIILVTKFLFISNIMRFFIHLLIN